MADLMPDLEDTIQALKSCSAEDGLCAEKECPYSSVCSGYGTPAMRNAIILLRAMELTEQEKEDLEIIHRIRNGKSLKVVNGSYTIVNEAWRKENPWVLPGEAVSPLALVKDPSMTNGTDHICGNCGGSFFHQKVNYCPWCGKVVKWNE